MGRVSIKGVVVGVAVACLVNLFLFSVIPGMAGRELPRKVASRKIPVTLEFMIPPAPPPEVKEKKEKPPEEPAKPVPQQLTMEPVVSAPRMDLDLPDPVFDLAGGVPVASAPMPGIFDEGRLDRPPMPTYKSPPVYPYRAKRMNITGSVTVRFKVSSEGTVSDVTVVTSDPPGVFDASVLKAVSTWKFAPGELLGEKVAVRVTRTIKFELN